MAIRTLLSAAVLLLLMLGEGGLKPSLRGDESTEKMDEATLRDAKFGTDGPALLEFFRTRTLSDQDQVNLKQTIRLLGDPRFGIRQKASHDLVAKGRAARRFLQDAVNDPDLEIALRAQRCLQELDNSTIAALELAAARLLSVRKPEGTSQVLLAYLPFTDDEMVEEEMLSALTSVGLRDGKPEALLVEALKDKISSKRAAAALVVGRSTEEAERTKVRSLLKDDDARVRLRASQGLLAARERDAVPALIALLSGGPKDVSWQAEELLCRIAGEEAPQISLGTGTDEERGKCRELWNDWWKNKGAKLDLAKIDMEQHALGRTVVVAYDGYQNGQGKVWEMGPDRKVLWQIDSDLGGPIDAQVLPGNRVLIAEYNARRVTERDFKGKKLWEKAVNGNPVACQRLPNGNTFIGMLNGVMEVTRDGKELYNHNNPNNNQGQITYAQKGRNGHIYYIATMGTLVEMDISGKTMKSVKVGGNNSEWLSFEFMPGGHYLVPQQSTARVSEVDASGKSVWSAPGTAPYSAVRLPNGNCIACSMNTSSLYEIDRAGKVIWQERLQGRPFRVRRR